MASSSKGFSEIVRLTSGFIGSEPLFFLLMTLLASLCGVIGIIRPELLVSHSVPMMLMVRSIQLIVLFLITDRWNTRLSIQRTQRSFGAWIGYILIGIGMWGAVMAPLLGLTLVESVSFLLFFLLGMGCYLSLQYYFYQIPFLFGSQGIRNSLSISREIFQSDKLMPLKIMGSASGITVLLYAIALAPFPDGRNVALSAIAQVASGLFWVLTSYLSLSAGCMLLSDRYWHEWKLDPYRISRFETLSKHGSSVIKEILSPKGAFVAFGLGTMCLLANFFRGLDMPPPASIALESVESHDVVVTVKLKLTDEKYHFRGTYPMNFALAGESRAVISPLPDSIKETNSGTDQRFLIPGKETQIQLTLTFKADRSGEELKALEDLYLWYRNVKLDHVKLGLP